MSKTNGITHFEGMDQDDFQLKELEELQDNLPVQKLPNFASFEKAYSKSSDGGYLSARKVFELIGGEVDHPNHLNACAARVSRALNYSGVSIGNIAGKTYKGDDNKYYFLGARKLYDWLETTFGKPQISLNTVQAGIDGTGFKNAANGRKGIYMMLPIDHHRFQATGHADIFYGDRFNFKGYFDPEGGLYSANLWVLG